MGLLKNEYKSFLDDIEKNVQNKQDLKYIKERFASFLDIMLDHMDYIVDYKKEEIEKLENTQNELSDKMEKMQQVLDNIEKDIYMDDKFDFEIVCPYCNYEFIVDIDDSKEEVTCPECENIIELDWSGDVDGNEQSCLGSCNDCHGCKDEDDDM